MRVLLSEINKFFKSAQYDLDGLAATLNRIGFEVEATGKFEKIEKIALGQVLAVAKHPSDDNLNICNVMVNDRLRQILTRAKIKKDIYVVVALPGCVLPNGKQIEQTTIKGERSDGMMLSLVEVGLEPQYLTPADQDSLIFFSPDNVANSSNKDPNHLIGIVDSWVEITLLQGRSYANNYYWLAKELAAFDRKQFHDWITDTSNELTTVKADFLVKNRIQEKINFFSAQAIEIRNNGKLGIMQKVVSARLQIIPHNIISTVAQYVTCLFGVPLALFDRDKFNSDVISIEVGKQEKIHDLEGNSYDIWENDLVVLNGSEAIEIAGIQQSSHAMIDDQTTRILVVIGNYDKTSIAKTSSRFNTVSESAKRYKKGINFSKAYVELMLRQFASLLYRNAILTNVSDLIISGTPTPPNRFVFKFETLYSYFGLTTRAEQNTARDRLIPLLNDVGISTLRQGGMDEGNVNMLVDPFRVDIETEACIVEEYSRLIDITKLKGKAPIGENKVTNFAPLRFENRFKDKLWMFGFMETKTYQLVNEAENQKFNIFGYDEPVQLSKLYGRNKDTMRSSIMSSLIDAYVTNANLNHSQIRFFETAKIFNGSTFTKHTAMLIDADFIKNSLNSDKVRGNFYTIRLLVELTLSSFGLTNWRTVKYTQKNEIFNPSEAIAVYVGNDLVAIYGSVHPKVLIDKKIRDKELYYAEFKQNPIALSILNEREIVYKPVGNLPLIKRSYNVELKTIGNKTEEIGPFIQAIKDSEQDVFDVVIKDVFKKDDLSIFTLEVSFNQKTTLTKDEINTISEKVEETIKKTKSH